MMVVCLSQLPRSNRRDLWAPATESERMVIAQKKERERGGEKADQMTRFVRK